ncbi:DNA repair protein RecN [bioreactor metagenome]|uniref:DNA repair protein RecN n=1 Tax=bioreactor metagenome TaxID=1076179 RepID=A0A644WFV0_9ZZZZ
MLQSLHIQNYALIRQLDVDFASGFTVITGETGAGKSILLGAIGLLAGNRADHGVLLSEQLKCIIEGQFILDKSDYENFFSENEIDFDGELIIRREISPGGKSRAFVNDTPVQLNLLKDLGDLIMNIHSQHETLLIVGNHFQMQTLDSYCGNNALLADYEQLFKKYSDTQQRISGLKESIARRSADSEYYGFLFGELEQASLSTEEESALQQEQRMLMNAEKIGEGLFGSLQMLSENDDNILTAMRRVSQQLHNASQYLPELAELAARIDQSLIEVSDVADTLNHLTEKAEVNPARLEKVNERLDEYNRLMHKHKVADVEQLLSVKNEIGSKLEDTSNLELKLAAEEKILAGLIRELTQISTELDKKRKKAAPVFRDAILEILNQLGMPNALFEAALENTENFRTDGCNTIRFLFTANKGEKLQDLGHVVSGGEMSRVMLAIKSMTAQRNMLPTIIFDEIDSGVSGVIAAKMGNILKKLSENHQVIAITHLPQIAARGEEHIHVEKSDNGEKVQTTLRKLDPEARVDVIARMISDEKLSDSALKMARELLYN